MLPRYVKSPDGTSKKEETNNWHFLQPVGGFEVEGEATTETRIVGFSTQRIASVRNHGDCQSSNSLIPFMTAKHSWIYSKWSSKYPPHHIVRAAPVAPSTVIIYGWPCDSVSARMAAGKAVRKPPLWWTLRWLGFLGIIGGDSSPGSPNARWKPPILPPGDVLKLWAWQPKFRD